MTPAKFIATTVATAAISVGLACPTASADTTPPSVLVIGDSITSHYNDITGDPMRGWWSYLADDMGMTPVLNAEGGSGFLRQGLGTPEGATCSGTRFYNRRETITADHPNVIIVEGGRNDVSRCLTSGVLQTSTTDQVRAAVIEYMQEVADRADALGLARDKVYVVTPWGSAYSSRRAGVTYLVQEYAELRGFQFIAVAQWGDQYTLDGTHPNEAGSAYFYRQILAHSDLGTRFDA